MEVTEEDISLFNQFNHYFSGEIVEKTPTIKPPNCTAALIHWRLISNIINIIGEEDIHFESGHAKSAPTESQDENSSESGSDSESGSSCESDELEEGEVQVKSKYAKSKASSKDVKGKVSSKSDVKSKPQEPMDTETAAEYKSPSLPNFSAHF